MAGSFEMSDVLSESTVDCHTLHDVTCSDNCTITVTLIFDQLPMIHNIERQKAKRINWKFEDAGLKRRFYHRHAWIVFLTWHLEDYCVSTGPRTQIG